MSSGCVRCGRCLTQCPTYRLTLDEKISSRGRLALIDARQEGRLKETTAFREALSACLLCGACERTCVNNVEVREQILAARAGLTGGLKRLALAATKDADRLDKAMSLARRAGGLLESSGLPGVIPEDSGLRVRFGHKELSLPPLAPKTLAEMFPQPFGPAQGEPVVLFPGCLANYSLPQVGRATIASLAGAGYLVHLPEKAGCCGLPASAAGLSRLAQKRAKDSVAALANKVSALRKSGSAQPKIAFLCASCHRRLAETLPLNWPETAGTMPELIDLAQALKDRLPELKNLRERVTFHDPCHSLGPEAEGEEAIDRPGLARELMNRLPGLELIESNAQPSCCGFGGLFSLNHPEMSSKIGADKAGSLKISGADLVATSCPACLLRLKELAGDSGVKACHLAELVVKRLDRSPGKD